MTHIDGTGFFARMTGWFNGDTDAPPEVGVDGDFGSGAGDPPPETGSATGTFQADLSSGFLNAENLGGVTLDNSTILPDDDAGPSQAPIDVNDGPIEGPGGGGHPAPEAPIDVGDGPIDVGPEVAPTYGSYQPDLGPGYTLADVPEPTVETDVGLDGFA